MKRIAILCSGLILAVTTAASAETLRLMTFNVRYPASGDGENHWEKRRDLFIDVGEVHDPPALGVELALDRDVDPVAVAVHACALVSRGHPGEEVRRLEPVAALQPRRHRAGFVARRGVLGKQAMVLGDPMVHAPRC